MLASSGLQTLVDELLMDQLKSCGYRAVSPVMCDQAIVYGDNALFGHAVGPQSWKNCYVHPCNGSGALGAMSDRGFAWMLRQHRRCSHR